MKKDITTKYLGVTIIFLIIFVLFQLLFQSLFFERFYTNKKTKTLKSNLEKFQKSYLDNMGRFEDTLINIKEFEEDNNAKLVILESNGLLSYITDPQNNKSDSGRIGIIKSIIEQWTSNPRAFSEMQNKGKSITYTFNDPYFNLKHIVTVVPVAINKRPAKVLFAISSLQPVNEAVEVMKEFYIYIYMASIIVILILSYKALSALKESNEKLKRDIEREKELENMRKEFVAAVSHELKTPISLIEGYAEGIKDNIVQGEEKDYYINVIIDEAKNMGDLVSEMLQLSKLESGKIKLKKEPFLLNKTINETIKKFQQIENKQEGINIITSIEDSIKVIGDEKKIEKVIVNLLTNAIEHTPKGKNIYIKATSKGNKAFVEIENEGVKIPENELKRIWGKFYKLDKSRNRTLGGTGLGLSIVKNILELHNSPYGAKNTEKGVTFWFQL